MYSRWFYVVSLSENVWKVAFGIKFTVDIMYLKRYLRNLSHAKEWKYFIFKGKKSAIDMGFYLFYCIDDWFNINIFIHPSSNKHPILFCENI